MIPIYELRKGSLISFDDYSMEAFEVRDMQHDGYGYMIRAEGGKNGEWINPPELVTGIPITLETMGAIGMIVDELGEIDLPLNNSWVDFDDDGEPHVNYNNHGFSYVKFIHQLQNFYLGITGQEMPLAEGAREKLCKILSK